MTERKGNVEHISKQAVIDEINGNYIDREYMSVDFRRGWNMSTETMLSCIETIPAADVVEVIRCRDCKHYSTHDMRCNKLHITPIPEFCYCLYGEKERNYESDINEDRISDDYCSFGERNVFYEIAEQLTTNNSIF